MYGFRLLKSVVSVVTEVSVILEIGAILSTAGCCCSIGVVISEFSGTEIVEFYLVRVDSDKAIALGVSESSGLL